MKSLIHNIAQMTKSALSSFRGKYWKDARYEYSGSDLVYMGMNTQHNAPSDKDTWNIWKITYVDGEPTRKEGPFVAAWDDRANLNWD